VQDKLQQGTILNPGFPFPDQVEDKLHENDALTTLDSRWNLPPNALEGANNTIIGGCAPLHPPYSFWYNYRFPSLCTENDVHIKADVGIRHS